MSPDVSGVGVAVAEALAPFPGTLPLSPWAPQLVKAAEIRTRKAMMRTRHGVYLRVSETREFTNFWGWDWIIAGSSEQLGRQEPATNKRVIIFGHAF